MKTQKPIGLAFCLGSFLLATHCPASDQVGTLTSIAGKVQVYSNPSKSVPKNPTPGNLAKYEDQLYYQVQDAQVGDRLRKGNIVRALPGSSARIVFDNGDQYNVGPGTAFQVFWNKDSPKTQTRIDLMYGKLRGVISKGGPRSHLRIRTKAAVMGVRGTDFFIASSGSSDPKDGGTEISIIRGVVEVVPTRLPGRQSQPLKPIQVTSGFTASIAPAVLPPATAQPAGTSPVLPAPAQVGTVLDTGVELRKTTQQDFAAIEKNSEFKTEKKTLPPAIAKLEEKAIETVMNDVKLHDPALYEKLQDKRFESPSEINSLAVETLSKDAPKAPEKHNPFKNEIEDLEGDSYQKYFKQVE